MMADMARHETLSKPLERLRNDNVLVEIGDRADQDGHDGLIVVPDYSRSGNAEQLMDVPIFATVRMVGPDVERLVGRLEVGSRVIIRALSGDRVIIDGREHRIVRAAAIEGVVES